jgi:hypothetical protein
MKKDIEETNETSPRLFQEIYRADVQEKGHGEKKKQHVIDFLDRQGIKITMSQLSILIEAAVHELNKNKLVQVEPIEYHSG